MGICKRRSKDPSKKRAAVLVFGDIGRSPRMQNHALQITKNTDYSVYLIGFLENQPYKELVENPNIEIVNIQSGLVNKLKKLPRVLYLLYALLRIIVECLGLFHLFLCKLDKPDFVIVQNPPSIPVLFVMTILSKLQGFSFILDFHNYGYTILGLNTRIKPVVWLAKKYEKLFARGLTHGLCVSEAMKEDLRDNWKVNAHVVYDKANTQFFKSISLEEKHELYIRLGLTREDEESLFTKKVGGKVVLRENRPILLISSTSWTKDEDFSILLNAMEEYDRNAIQPQKEKSGDIQIKPKFPHLYLIITGKGPEKERYLKMIAEKENEWKYITIKTKWLEANDYPKLLAAADLGICLHYSSSGVDLPMKVVDMFGAELPVLAIDYRSIGELVRNGETGYIFKDTKVLAQLLIDIFCEYPDNAAVLDKFKKNIKKFRERTFEIEWKEAVLPLLSKKRKSD